MGKTYERRNVKATYFNPNIINKIGTKIRLKNFQDADLMLEKYLDDYPDDEIALLYKARILVNIGDVEEGKHLADCIFDGNKFHNKKAYTSACLVYIGLLMDLKEFEKAEELVVDLLNRKDIPMKGEDFTLSVNYLSQVCFRQYKFKEFIDYCELIDCLRDSIIAKTKKASAYMYDGQEDEALALLDELYDSLDDSVKIQANYYYGKIFESKYRDTNDFGYLLTAKEHFHKTLKKKSAYYYLSCFYLAEIYRLLEDNNKSLAYADKALTVNENVALVEELDPNYVHFIKLQLYLKMHDFASAKEQIDQMSDSFIKTRALVMYSYFVGDYEFCMIYCEKVFNDEKTNYFRSHLEFYINSLIRLKQYDKARYFINSILTIPDELDEQFVEKCRVLMDLNEFKPVRNHSTYTSKQLVGYDEDLALKHIASKHLLRRDPYSPAFDNFLSVKAAYEYARNTIDPKNAIPSGLMDIHHLRLPNCGVYDGSPCNSLMVVTIPGTNNIITMYPVIEPRESKSMEVIDYKESEYKNLLSFKSMSEKRD